MRSSRTLAALGLVAALGRTACRETPSSPTPSPSPSSSPALPDGKANATAFENLALIRSLEQATGRKTILVWISGGATPQGIVDPGAAWIYQFAQVEASGSVTLYEWNVLPTGQLQLVGRRPELIRLDITEIGPFLAVDSQEATRLGREYGAQAFVDRYPQTLVEMSYSFQGGLPVCEMAFAARPSVGCAIRIFIQAKTGELMARDLSCYDRLSSQ